jgi:hypothetical protein
MKTRRIALASHDIGPSIRFDRMTGADDEVIYRRSAVLAQRVDPDDVNPNRVQRLVVGAEIANPLMVMHRRSGIVTVEHLAAVARFETDCEIGLHGAHPPRANIVHTGAGAHSMYPEDRVLAAIASMRGAMRAMGLRGSSIVAHVAIGMGDPIFGYQHPIRRDVAAWAEAMGMPPERARGFLLAALDALDAHYNPPSRSAVDDILHDRRTPKIIA